jgi:hypothetical protein
MWSDPQRVWVPCAHWHIFLRVLCSQHTYLGDAPPVGGLRTKINSSRPQERLACDRKAQKTSTLQTLSRSRKSFSRPNIPNDPSDTDEPEVCGVVGCARVLTFSAHARQSWRKVCQPILQSALAAAASGAGASSIRYRRSREDCEKRGRTLPAHGASYSFTVPACMKNVTHTGTR